METAEKRTESTEDVGAVSTSPSTSLLDGKPVTASPDDRCSICRHPVYGTACYQHADGWTHWHCRMKEMQEQANAEHDTRQQQNNQGGKTP